MRKYPSNISIPVMTDQYRKPSMDQSNDRQMMVHQAEDQGLVEKTSIIYRARNSYDH